MQTVVYYYTDSHCYIDNLIEYTSRSYARMSSKYQIEIVYKENTLSRNSYLNQTLLDIRLHDYLLGVQCDLQKHYIATQFTKKDATPRIYSMEQSITNQISWYLVANVKK